MITILAKLRRGGPKVEGSDWDLVAHRERLVVCASRMPTSEADSCRLRTAIHRMCVQHGLLGSYVPLFDSLERDETAAGESLSDAQPFYVTNVSFPAVEVSVQPPAEESELSSARYATLFAA